MPYKSKFNKDEGDLYTGTRICKICNIRKPMNDFYWVRNIRVRKCKPCVNILTKEFRKKNKKKYQEINFNSRLRRKYGITSTEWEQLMEKQHNQCAICYNGISRTNCNVDHDHDSGNIRGLLCSNCNTAIGKSHDSIPYLQSAIQYLSRAIPNIKYRSKKLSNNDYVTMRAHGLTDFQVMEVIKKYKAGGVTQKELALEYQVTQSLITKIMNGKAHHSILKQYEEMVGRS